MAAELQAARDLIKGYEAQIAALDARLALALTEIELYKQISGLETSRSASLQEAIAAEREAKRILEQQKTEQAERIAALEKRLDRAKRVGLITTVAAAVAILIGIRR
jgi:uncharacterized protein involved in exopolysaccharide biosynthesis